MNHYKRVIGAGLTLKGFAPFHTVCALKILLYARKVKTHNTKARQIKKGIIVPKKQSYTNTGGENSYITKQQFKSITQL